MKLSVIIVLATVQNYGNVLSNSTPAANKNATNCEEAFVYGNKQSGFYTMSGGYEVFCQFDCDGTGYTFPSRQALDNPEFNITNHYSAGELNRVLIRVIRHDDVNVQFDNVIRQIETEQNRSLGVFHNRHPNYQGPRHNEPASYIFVGLLPDALASQSGMMQGLNSNGRDFTFENCDANGNSLFAFFNTLDGIYGSTFRTRYEWNLGIDWRGTLEDVPASHIINSTEYVFAVQMHFGGCGDREMSLDWPNKTDNSVMAKGAAIGLPFRMTDDCAGVTCRHGHICVNASNVTEDENPFFSALGIAIITSISLILALGLVLCLYIKYVRKSRSPVKSDYQYNNKAYGVADNHVYADLKDNVKPQNEKHVYSLAK